MAIHIWDLDGTVWRPARTPLCISSNLLTHPKWAQHGNDYDFYPEAMDRIKQQHQAGDTVLCCTNQGGSPMNVKLGQYKASKHQMFNPPKSLQRLAQEQTMVMDTLPFQEIWWSPGPKSRLIYRTQRRSTELIWQWSLRAGCCHKPNPAMLLDIWSHYPAEEYYFWGDSTTDKLTAYAAAAQGMPIKFKLVGWR